MSNPDREVAETKTVSENADIQSAEGNQSTNTEEKSEKSSSTSDNQISNEPETKTITRRIVMPQDIRYATEQDDRDKLIEKYNNYQVSDINSCHVRFLTDHRQKKNLLGRNEEENSKLRSIAKTFDVNISPAYQNPVKHSFKVFGTEANVRKCLIDVSSRMVKSQHRSTTQGDNESKNQRTSATSIEKTEGTEVSTDTEKTDENPCADPTEVFVTTINSDASTTEERKRIIPLTPNRNEEKTDAKAENTEEEPYKFVPLERKPEYTFIVLITSQGQEVLKKNWGFFAGSLQQRLNVTVTNPLRLPKFGDNQWQNELSITGESHENIIDAVLQITAFINDVLGVPNQPYKADEEPMSGDSPNYQRAKMNNNNDYYQQKRRQDYNSDYRQSPSQHQGQSSTVNNYHDRTFVNRGRNGVYEQILLLRSNCVPRIVGTRGSNIRRIQSKCHLRDIIIARHSNENGYVECTLSAYQTRNLNFAIDTIRNSLRNEDDQAIQVFDSYYVDLPPQSSPFQNDQPQLSASNETPEHYHQPAASFTALPELRHPTGETGFMTTPSYFNISNQLPQPSYNFQNTPSFDFTHQPTSASRKTDKRPGEVNDLSNTNNGPSRTPNETQCLQNGGSSSSNSSSISPRHKSKRTCPETKDIDCTTDEGFWIQKQYYHALDEPSKELFDSLLDQLEKIRITNDENAARKQQRLVGRNRPNKSRGFSASIISSTQPDEEKISSQQDEQATKVEQSTGGDEQKETKELPTTEQEPTAVGDQ